MYGTYTYLTDILLELLAVSTSKMYGTYTSKQFISKCLKAVSTSKMYGTYTRLNGQSPQSYAVSTSKMYGTYTFIDGVRDLLQLYLQAKCMAHTPSTVVHCNPGKLYLQAKCMAHTPECVARIVRRGCIYKQNVWHIHHEAIYSFIFI